MQIIELDRDRLVLSFRRSLVLNSLFGIGFVLVGLFFCLIGLFLAQRSTGTWILPAGMGGVSVVGGIAWTIYLYSLPHIEAFTFDRARKCLICERQSFFNKSSDRMIEIPLDLIDSIEISSPFSGADSPTLYYPNLILDRVYWRIHLNSDGSYDMAVKIATTVSEFLQVKYFADESKAPLRFWDKKILEESAPYRFDWKYLEDEVERLKEHLERHPSDAETYQALGLLRRSHLNESIAYLQQAENLFTARQEHDRAVLARVLQDLAIWC